MFSKSTFSKSTFSKSRSAFTLIELLIVISILAILAALTVAVVTQVHQSQKVSNTRKTVTTLQLKMNERVTQVIERARSPKNAYRNAALTYCGGDSDLANSLLCYAYLRLEFPETFREAKQSFVLLDSSGTPVIQIPPSPRFSGVPSGFTTIIPGDQAAILLYLALADDQTDSMVVGVDSATGWHYFKDAFGMPIMFQRWLQNSDTNGAPYTNPRLTLRDSLDPAGKLATWSNLSALRFQAGCMTIGDNQNKVITIQSSLLPSGEVMRGYQEVGKK